MTAAAQLSAGETTVIITLSLLIAGHRSRAVLASTGLQLIDAWLFLRSEIDRAHPTHEDQTHS